MKFEFQKFEQEMCDLFADKLDRKVVTELLDLGDEYDKDTPLSTGKRLTVAYVAFRGEKQSDGSNNYSGNLINYACSIETGVNMWVADNLKGKSSIFKIIKFALTGSNSLKSNIKAWINEIIVNFSVGERKYTVFMDTRKRLKAFLLSGTYASADEVRNAENGYLIEAKSESEYSSEIQNFFFKQFSYYSLKWTQKNPSKDKNELLEVGASWNTYFSSILLESKDSDIMYGAQGKKIFEMLLGLELTYPINRLKVKSDILRDEMAKNVFYKQRQAQNLTESVSVLREQRKEIDEKLAAMEVGINKQGNVNELIDQYNSIIEEIKKDREVMTSIDTAIRQRSTEIERLKNKQHISESEHARIHSEIRKITRNINDLKEYLEIGIFFSNLEITQCPSCNHSISEDRRKDVATTHKCYVCSDPINEGDLSDDPVTFEEKIVSLESLLLEYKEEENKLSDDYELLAVEIQSKNTDIQILQNKLKAVQDANFFVGELNNVEAQINSAKMDKINEEQRAKLIAERAVLDFQIKQIATNNELSDTDNENASKIDMLDMAVSKLTKQRYNIGQKVINRLSVLMLSELHELGLNSISAIQITDKFEILYQQDGELMNFNTIAEGEQLRAKIAFYLSLIQLDIEFNFGRHTRLLIIDSPGKEEADKNYLEGFSSIISGIQERFGDRLQILIGTAQRELIDVVDQQFVMPPNTFVF